MIHDKYRLEILSEKQGGKIPEIMIRRRLISQVKIPPRDLILLAIFRIFPRRSLELPFFGVDEEERFLLVAVPLGLAVDDDDDDEGLEMVVVNGFFRGESDDEGSISKI